MDSENPNSPDKKTIRTFAWASFLNDMGSDIISPVWPLFVTQVLKANMAALGFLDGLGEALVSLSKALAGYASDRLRKRKIFIWTGYLCGGISRWGYALSSVWPHLIPFRILDRAGKIRSSPRDAMIADMSTSLNRGRHFGIIRAMDNGGPSSASSSASLSSTFFPTGFSSPWPPFPAWPRPCSLSRKSAKSPTA